MSEKCWASKDKPSYHIIIVTCNNNVININKKINNMTTNVEDKQRSVSIRSPKARGDKILAKLVVPGTRCFLKPIDGFEKLTHEKDS